MEQQNKNSKLCKIISCIFMVITVLISIGASIIILLSRSKFLELYKELKNYDTLPSLTKFLLSPLGNMSLSIFFISVAIFMSIKEFRMARKKTSLILNIVTLIFVILVFLIYASVIVMPVLDGFRTIS